MQIILLIYQDLVKALSYVPSAFWIIIAIIAAIVMAVLHYKKKVTFKRTVIYFLLLFYILTMLNYTFLSREPGSRSSIDFKFLSTWGNTSQSHAYFIENIFMFIPLGAILPNIWQTMNRWGRIVLVSFLGSLLLETMQLLTGRGYFQVDDIITNLLGGILGYIMYVLAQRIKL